MDQYTKMGKNYIERFEKINANYNGIVAKLAERVPKEEQVLLDKLSYYEEKVAFDNMKQRGYHSKYHPKLTKNNSSCSSATS